MHHYEYGCSECMEINMQTIFLVQTKVKMKSQETFNTIKCEEQASQTTRSKGNYITISTVELASRSHCFEQSLIFLRLLLDLSFEDY